MLKSILLLLMAVPLIGEQDSVKPVAPKDFPLLFNQVERQSTYACAIPLKELHAYKRRKVDPGVPPSQPNRFSFGGFDTRVFSDRIDEGIKHPLPMPVCPR